jgi:hypothetical protein
VAYLGAVERGLSAIDAVKKGTGAATVLRYAGNATELALTRPTSGGRRLPAEVSVLNFHGGLYQWHQGLTLSPMNKSNHRTELPEITKKKLSVSISISDRNR